MTRLPTQNRNKTANINTKAAVYTNC